MIERIAGRTDFVYQILDEYDGDKDIDKLLADSEMHVLTGKYLSITIHASSIVFMRKKIHRNVMRKT